MNFLGLDGSAFIGVTLAVSQYYCLPYANWLFGKPPANQAAEVMETVMMLQFFCRSSVESQFKFSFPLNAVLCHRAVV